MCTIVYKFARELRMNAGYDYIFFNFNCTMLVQGVERPAQIKF